MKDKLLLDPKTNPKRGLESILKNSAPVAHKRKIRKIHYSDDEEVEEPRNPPSDPNVSLPTPPVEDRRNFGPRLSPTLNLKDAGAGGMPKEKGMRRMYESCAVLPSDSSSVGPRVVSGSATAALSPSVTPAPVPALSTGPNNHSINEDETRDATKEDENRVAPASKSTTGAALPGTSVRASNTSMGDREENPMQEADKEKKKSKKLKLLQDLLATQNGILETQQRMMELLD